MTDDMSSSQLRYMPITRRLIEREGTTFSQYHTVQPQCCPSRASILTGEYPHNNGVISNKFSNGGGFERLPKDNLPVWLTKAGYHTGWIGKYLNGYGEGGAADKRLIPGGWDYWQVPPGGEHHKMYDFKLNANGRIEKHPDDDPTADYQTNVYADKAVDYIAHARPDEPYFLAVNSFAPHWEPKKRFGCRIRTEPRFTGEFKDEPLPPSGGAYRERNILDKPHYIRQWKRRWSLTSGPKAFQRSCVMNHWHTGLEALQSVDQMVKRIIAELKRTGQLRHTIVVFTSDNGHMYGEHWLNNKDYPYEESVRVPLLIRGPGFKKGAVRNDLVGNIDFASTFDKISGAKPELRQDGYSLVGPHRRTEILLEAPEVPGPLLAPPWHAIKTDNGLVYVSYEDGEEELYDLRTDPHQLDNLVGNKAYARKLDRLRADLRAVRDCAGKACP